MIEQSASGKTTIYQDPTLKGKTLLGYKGTSFLDAGYFFAPYVPLFTTPTLVFPTAAQIKEETRIPIKIIKTAMKQAGYKINRDFTLETDPFAAIVIIQARPGRRFTDYGQCRASTMRKGKLSVTWTYEPMPGGKSSKNVDITLADPGCFQQVSDTIIAAVKENNTKPIGSLHSRYGYNKRQHNTSYYSTIKITL